MSVKRPPILFVALAITAALALAGCGGGDDDAATATSGSAGSTSQQGGDGSQGSGGGQGALDTSDLPESEEGSKKAAPGVPVSRGGDNSIQTWGVEASSAERAEVTAILQAFLDARAAADWAKACSHLAAEQRAEFERLLRGRKRGNAACAETMRAFAQGIPAGAFAEEAEIADVLSFRIGGGYAFLIYRRPDGIFATALSREDGRWKVISVTPNPIS